jgi:23S rRNA-/tRNA-specific pseudouridylate synthase
MNTSGVLLVGKNSHAQDSLAKQGAAGGVEKIYTAILAGRLADDLPPAGLIDLPIGLASPGEPQRAVLPETSGGIPCRTAYEILRTLPSVFRDCGAEEDLSARFPGTEESALTLIRARLITGRTHQIRVHFAHYGHPVLGDHLYGCPSPLIARQALHASDIAFAHPSTGRPMRFSAILPADIAALI